MDLWFALRLPLFSDDIVPTRWLSWRSLPALWRSVERMGYFRPLTFGVWKVVNLLRGSSDPVALHWQCWAGLGQETSVFVHLYHTGGELAAQADGYPLLGKARRVAWQAGDPWRDVCCVPLHANLPGGPYPVKVGLYPTGAARPKATRPGGAGSEDEAVPVATLAWP